VIAKKLSTFMLLLLVPAFIHAADGKGKQGGIPFSSAFEGIAVEQGLSNHNISSICQDSLGYIWIGTARGLNRYDGLTYKQFLFSPEGNTPGIPYDFIEHTFYCNNNIFVSTRRGAAAYNMRSGAWHSISDGLPVQDMMQIGNRAFFIRQKALFEYDFQENKLVRCDFPAHLRISLFIPSDDGQLWGISDDYKQVYCYNFESKELVGSPLNDAVPIPGTFHEIIDHHLFLSTESGLKISRTSVEGRILNESSKLFKQFKGSSMLSFFLSVERWDASRVLISFFEQGMYLYDLQKGTLTKIPKEDSGLDSDLIKALFKDRDGNLWVGTFDKGLEVYYNKQNEFNFDRQLNILAPNEFVNTITWNDYRKELLLGTRTQGVVCRNKTENTSLNTKLRSLDIFNVIILYPDSEQKIWIGGYDKLVIYNQRTGRILKPEDHLNLNHIQDISEKDGLIYLVADNGFYIYTLDGKLVKHVLENVTGANQIVHFNRRSILCSELSGLYSYERSSGETEHLSLLKFGKAFNWQGAVCMDQETDSILWIGTLSWGLIRVDLSTLESVSYTMENGLPGNDVTAIERDEQGRMWLSTSDGISCMYTPGRFNNFSSHEGIGNDQFHRRSSFTDSKGTIYFGGNNGISYFNPSELTLNAKFDKHTYFQDIIINDSRVEVGDESAILSKTLPFTDELVFTHRVTNFSVDYSAIEFYAHDQVLYSQMLEGWDTRWQVPNRSQRVNYSNLPPGNYTLWVKARRSSGEWSDPSSLKITLKPAPWKTWWAITIYVLGFIFMVFLFFSMRFRNQMIASNLKAEHRERARESEVNEMKLRFFTNISHEFRTPLSVINGVTSLLSKHVDFEGYSKELFTSLNLNVDRLIRLINQLLTFRELESDTLSLSVRQEKIDILIEKTCKTLSNYARVKNISLLNSYSAPIHELLCDADKVEKVLSNLISNAIKYTPEGGIINVKGKIRSKDETLGLYRKLKKRSFPLSESGYLEIRVKDNGRGIRKKDIETIFKRYSKTDRPSIDADYSSSGIGLNFVKRLVIVHKGDIRVKSTYKQGSEFSFLLPLDKDIYADEQQVSSIIYESKSPLNVPEIPAQAGQISKENSEQNSRYKIAIIEDDLELCKLLTNTLSTLYSVCYANDGRAGLETIRKEKPDLVISDIMMPGMNGIELCMELKQDESLSHIIVILLSAKSEISDQIEGISKGADLYIPKPFSLDYLLTVISSQIRSRDEIHKLYLKGLSPELSGVEANQEVIQFLSRVNSVLEKEVSNLNLSVDVLSEKMNIGRSTFYKKFTAITHTSPNVYIAKYRLNKAEELLREFKYSISEISDLTGFRNASYFSTIFKKEKGITPREYLKKLNKNDDDRPSA
jgi:signal transduction histidine kinase/DNA-binding response OmpR family regulator/ligand-binding sensor domain-containing protein